MAIGAYAAYNFLIRVPHMPLLGALILGGLSAAAMGILFGIPSLRVRGLYLAVATLAAQFFADWAFLRIKWFTNDSSSGSVSVSNLDFFGLPVESPVEKYLFCLSDACGLALLAKNLTRASIGRQWMAIRDMDVAAEVIGIRPMWAKLSAFAVSSFYRRRRRRHVGLHPPRLLGAGGVLGQPFIPASFHGHHRWHGLDRRQFLRRRLHRHPADFPQPVPAAVGALVGVTHFHHRGRRTPN